MKKYKSKWEVLRKTIKLAERALKCSIKYTDYADAIKYDCEISSLSWILREVNSIEKTGEAL